MSGKHCVRNFRIKCWMMFFLRYDVALTKGEQRQFSIIEDLSWFMFYRSSLDFKHFLVNICNPLKLTIQPCKILNLQLHKMLYDMADQPNMHLSPVIVIQLVPSCTKKKTFIK